MKILTAIEPKKSLETAIDFGASTPSRKSRRLALNVNVTPIKKKPRYYHFLLISPKYLGKNILSP